MKRFTSFLNESISKYVKSTVPEFMKQERYKSVSEINYWSCSDFALAVHDKIKDAGIKGCKVVTGPGHTWITHNGKHYDAEHPNGVSHPKKLNYYKRENKDRVKLLSKGKYREDDE